MTNKVLIIGGGPAGLEASNQLSLLGYKPVIVEKSDILGGHLAKWDRLFPESESAEAVLYKLIKPVEHIPVYFNSIVEEVNREGEYFHVKLSGNKEEIVSAIVVCAGFSLFAAEKKEEYGYGIYNNVITSSDLESWFKTGKDSRINNPAKVGFVHCVGSRDEKICNRQCSKVCCVTAVKQAVEIKEMFPQADVYCFYMDLRMFGRKYEDLYLRAQNKFGIRFIRGRVSEVSEDVTGRVVIKAEDTLSSKPLKISFDLLVLMTGMVSNSSIVKLSEILSLAIGEDGFIDPQDSIIQLQESGKEGIFLAGAITGPKTIPETLNEARASALSVHNYLNKKKVL
ncbi:MAG: hypothetical protein ACD_77C00342G0024 [uncultured bacterium]|nr:MAG: hypothetical protein ACD_77C00342G0024 [uncultured bacterium]